MNYLTNWPIFLTNLDVFTKDELLWCTDIDMLVCWNGVCLKYVSNSELINESINYVITICLRHTAKRKRCPLNAISVKGTINLSWRGYMVHSLNSKLMSHLCLTPGGLLYSTLFIFLCLNCSFSTHHIHKRLVEITSLVKFCTTNYQRTWSVID